jgi:hypothetical protein
VACCNDCETVYVHKVEAREAADDPLDLARRPTTCLRSSSYDLKKKRFQEVRRQCYCFVLTSWCQAWVYHNERGNQPDVVTRLVAVRTNNINVEAGDAKQSSK